MYTQFCLTFQITLITNQGNKLWRRVLLPCPLTQFKFTLKKDRPPPACGTSILIGNIPAAAWTQSTRSSTAHPSSQHKPNLRHHASAEHPFSIHPSIVHITSTHTTETSMFIHPPGRVLREEGIEPVLWRFSHSNLTPHCSSSSSSSQVRLVISATREEPNL
jgi:hypothetical protein